MTKERAQELLQEVLMTLARNSVHEKRLLEYADDLERYIAYLDKQDKTEAEAPAEEESEPKAE